MPSPDQIAAATWDKVLARLEGADEPDAPTSPTAPATGENLPAWWVAIAAVPTVGSTAAPTPVATAPAPTATAAPPPPIPEPAPAPAPAPASAYREPVGVELFRQRCKRFATNPIASIFR